MTSPLTSRLVNRRPRRRGALLLGLLAALIVPLASLTLPGAASASPPDLDYYPSFGQAPSWWGTNGRVTDIVPAGGRVYLSGGFDYVGPSTGYGVGVSAGSGQMLPGAPLVDGLVRAAVPDGSGGWYIGGSFSHVGGAYRPGAAQVTASGNVTGWAPRPKGSVLALAVNGSTVYLGGDFVGIGTSTAARLAAVDATTGAVLPGWSAAPNATVRALVTAGSSLFAGGDFTTVNGVTRGRLAKLSLSTGALDGTFRGGTTAPVTTLALSPDRTRLYGGGTFTWAGNGTSWVTRYRLAGWYTSSGGVTTWAPSASWSVNALAVNPSNGTVYVGGGFSYLNGSTRIRVGAVTSTGALTGFNAALNGCHLRHTTGYARNNPPCSPVVNALTVSGGSVYVGGNFSNSGATSRHNAAAFSLSTGALTGWNPVAGDRPLALAGSGNAVFVGGEMTSVNGAVRKGLAALDAQSGAVVSSFRADTDNEVLDLQLAPNGSRLYLAGSFLHVQGQAHSKMASINTSTGLVDPLFHPSFNQDVIAIGYGGGALFAAGQFTSVNGNARSHVAKISGYSGAVYTGFVTNTVGPTGTLRAGGMALTLAVKPDGSLVFVGGPFTTVNGRAVAGGIAVVSGSTGALNARQLGGVGTCSNLGPWITHLYLSADGKRLYGGDVCPDYIYQWDAVNLSSTTNTTGLIWRTICNGGMQGALEVNGDFYYGTHGNLCRASTTNTTNVVRQRFAVFDAGNGTLLPDAPPFDSAMGIWSFAAVPQGLLIGGDFTWVGTAGRVQQGLVLVTGTP